MPSMVRLMCQLKSVLKYREAMLKNTNFFFISVTLKSWSGRELFGPHYVSRNLLVRIRNVADRVVQKIREHFSCN